MPLTRNLKRTLLAGSLLVVGVLVIALLVWVLYLDRIITAQFEGRRWTLPAQVYAEPLELYCRPVLRRRHARAGAQAAGLSARRRGRSSRAAISRRGTRIDLVNRRFQFWDALQEPQLLTIVTRGNAIESMRNGRDEEVPIFRLDPLLIGSIFPIHGEDRVVVTPEEVPPLLPAALKVVEDRKFDTHHGVNFGAIMRAAWVNLRAGQIEQGGSTLTQQLVKSYFLDNRRTFGRKIEEAFMAMLLEVHFEQAGPDERVHQRDLSRPGRQPRDSRLRSREPVLFRQTARGTAAARGRAAGRDRARSFVLRSAPASERVQARRDLVLKLMARTRGRRRARRRRTRAQATARHRQRRDTQAGGYYPAFLDLVRRTLRRDYREEDLTEAGLKIFSTLNPLVQSQRRKSADAGARSARQGAQAEERDSRSKASSS